MTDEDFKKLKFHECNHAAFATHYSTLYKCVSEPFQNRLYIHIAVKRDKYTGNPIGKDKVYYYLDGKLYSTKEELLEAIKDIEYGK